MAIDHGLKRIGLAVSDESGLVAREIAIINRTSNAQDFARINHIAAEYGAAAFIVGLPDSSHAGTGVYTQADTVKNWVKRFRQTTTLPIRLWEENLTSADAREIAVRQKRKPRDPIDDLAARVILQSYLDALRDGLAELPTSNVLEE
jgi:putative Holliday junction resolvase